MQQLCKINGGNQPESQFLVYFKFWKILHLNQFPVFNVNSIHTFNLVMSKTSIQDHLIKQLSLTQ